ncbi:preprotein translocase subunit SecY [Fervidicoccus fontis Kam940]|uniref:Protein translocase subunit SecY n=1 Tax=Fervidicoccus fontis (strain DSM 19380 / JCM 18336 / VKM B-2539 / Kam940) TaxID=1163730 RepID=I0A0I0_FERFK|nr:preprotein translocase subunit SecY [Fervidicoccus fontis]AFH42487.1 preprotein translocase subunit SecY [Fervidicoccus fontis Kam940]
MSNYLGFLDALAKFSYILPTVKKPSRKLSLYRRLGITGLVLVLYLIMADTPLYGVPYTSQSQISLFQILFAANTGTLMELGIGPIVTGGLILQILVGAKLIDLDLSDVDDRRKFTEAQKTLSFLFGIFEALAYVLASRYWPYVGNPITGSQASWAIRIGVLLQLTFATYLVMVFDEMLQKGWGIGSAISLFILAGVAKTMFWDLFGYTPQYAQQIGLIPYIVQATEANNLTSIVVRQGLPDVVGLLATIIAIIGLVYLQGMRVEIPVTSQKYGGIRSKIPLQFLYVTNIPILLVGIIVSDFQLFANAFASISGTQNLGYRILYELSYYLSPPRGLYSATADLTKLFIFIISWVVLSVLFGYMWVEIAGLGPKEQADRLIKGELDIPGVRRNPKFFEKMLAKYIYPLTVLSSLIVAFIAIVADIFGAYGSGTGILLAVGIINQYYMMIARERALEAYPLLKRIMGE